MTSTRLETDHAGSGLALLAVLMPAMLATVIASDMVNLLLPAIGTEFDASEAELAWVVTGFLLMFSVGIPFYGRLSDRVSLRTLFVVCLTTYAAGSLVSALAPSLLALVAGRIVMGIGAAGIPVLTILGVTRLLPAEKRGMGIGVISAAAGIGTAAGPALGGGIGQLLGWHAPFWLMVAIALVLLPLIWRVLPADSPTTAERFDLTGGILLGAAAGLLLFGITQAQVAGFTAPSAWGCLVVGMATLVVFVGRNRRIDRPFVPPALFDNQVFRIAVIVVSLAMSINLGALVFVPIVLVDVDGLDPGTGALVMIPAGLAVAMLSPLSGRLADRIGARTPTLTGLAVMGLSAVFLSTVAGGGSLVLTAIGITALCAGFIFVMTPIISAAAGALAPAQAGIGLGILQGAQFLGASAGPALFGALVSARRQAGTDALNPLNDTRSGAAFSDAFLAMAFVAVTALIIALWMRPTPASNELP
ncbi:MFS transporter [Nocardia sp. NPDC058114]|uniref:MFS transporter n=1 Tax=Nocardia sp. NPDC058114 TaxID=3346346 RepID=UPI0036D7687B